MLGHGRQWAPAESYAGLMLSALSLIFSNDSVNCASVRDRGVGGSNPLAPTNFLNKSFKFSRSEHSVSPESAGGSNRF